MHSGYRMPLLVGRGPTERGLFVVTVERGLREIERLKRMSQWATKHMSIAPVVAGTQSHNNAREHSGTATESGRRAG
jgi:hypothetical protein